MNYRFEVGQYERHYVELRYEVFFGQFKAFVDGRLVFSDLPFFAFGLTRTFQFYVGMQERHLIRVEKTRKLFFPAFQPQQYRIYIDNYPFTQFQA